MPLRKRPLRSFKEDDAFETEALSYLNEEKADRKNKLKKFESDESDPELSGSEDSDVEEKLLLENEEKPQEDSDENDDDDDAPESVGFSESRETAISQMRSAMKQIDTAKAKQKINRQKREAQFKEQKAQKLAELSKVKLPEDVLEDLDEKIPKKKKKKKEEKKQTNDIIDDFEKPDDLDPRGDMLEGSDPGSPGEEEYISLTDSASGVKVTELKYLDRTRQTLAESAAAFRQNRQYGSHIRRESNKQRMAKKEKRRHRLR